MNSVDTSVAKNPMVRGCPRSPHFGWTGTSMTGVQPTVRPPRKSICQVVPTLLVPETIEEDFWRGVGTIVPVSIGDEVQVGWRHDPHASKSNFNSGYIVQSLEKYLPRLGSPVVID